MADAADGLTGLNEQGLLVAKDEVMEGAKAGVLRACDFGGAGEAVTAHLHVNLVQAEFSTDERRGAHDGFKAEETDLYLKAIAKGSGHRADAILNKDEVADWFAGVLYFQSSSQLSGFELEASGDLAIKGGEQLVSIDRPIHDLPLYENCSSYVACNTAAMSHAIHVYGSKQHGMASRHHIEYDA